MIARWRQPVCTNFLCIALPQWQFTAFPWVFKWRLSSCPSTLLFPSILPNIIFSNIPTACIPNPSVNFSLWIIDSEKQLAFIGSHLIYWCFHSTLSNYFQIYNLNSQFVDMFTFPTHCSSFFIPKPKEITLFTIFYFLLAVNSLSMVVDISMNLIFNINPIFTIFRSLMSSSRPSLLVWYN